MATDASGAGGARRDSACRSATALEPISRASSFRPRNSFDSLVAWYAADGWRADRLPLTLSGLPRLRPSMLVANVVRAFMSLAIQRPCTAGLRRSKVSPWTSALKSDAPEKPGPFRRWPAIRHRRQLQEARGPRAVGADGARLAPVPTATATAKPSQPVFDAMARTRG